MQKRAQIRQQICRASSEVCLNLAVREPDLHSSAFRDNFE